MTNKILVIDSETTGKKDSQPVELAFLNIDFPSLEIKDTLDIYFKPTIPIEYGALATHHITRSFLEDKPVVFGETYTHVLEDFHSADYYIAHNCDFDWTVLGSPDIKRICTLAISRYLYPELDSHTQSAMLYYFFGDKAREMVKDAHNALADVQNCLKLFNKLLFVALARGEIREDCSIEDVWEFSEKCRIPEVITFGKHAGMRIADLPWDYKKWILGKEADFDPYLIKAIRATL